MRHTEGVLQLEHMQLRTDAGQQGWMPLSVCKDQQRGGRLPAIIFLHATGGPAVFLQNHFQTAHASHGTQGVLVSLTKVLQAHQETVRVHLKVQVQIRRR